MHGRSLALRPSRCYGMGTVSINARKITSHRQVVPLLARHNIYLKVSSAVCVRPLHRTGFGVNIRIPYYIRHFQIPPDLVVKT